MRVHVRSTMVLVAAAIAVVASACSTSSGSPSQPSGKPVNGGTVTWAEPVGIPNWILPLEPPADQTAENGLFIPLMWRSLYDVGGNGAFAITNLGMADPPVFSPDGRSVTITLKPWKWSDGTPVTTRDFTFMFNLVKANKTAIGGYVPGLFPDDITSISVTNQHTFTLHLTHPFAHDWFTYNQLSFLTPLPQHAWDKTSASGAVGNYDLTTSGAQAVFNFLISQSKNTSGYATNPLWKIVDGPWKLSQYQNNGYSVFVPNRNYSGPNKPRLAKFIEEPFTSSTAELNALRTGQLDVGYLPAENLNEQKAIGALGYKLNIWPSWGFNYIQINFNNPVAGPLFRQLYIRQALQYLIDEPSYLKNAFKGLGWTFYGPVPPLPANPFYSPVEKANSYPFDPAKAVSLLRAHGWTVKPNGVSTCAKAGSGASQCGTGITGGTPLQFNLLYLSGSAATDQIMQAFQSDASTAGVKLSLSSAPFNTVYGESTRCTSGQPTCKWQMNYYSGWGYGSNLPSGETLFTCNGSSNYGSFCDPETDKLVQQTLTVGGPAAYAAYQARIAHEAPELWLPGGAWNLTEYKDSLHGVVPQNPVELIYPERWYYTS